jgi:hypothetical protein
MMARMKKGNLLRLGLLFILAVAGFLFLAWTVPINTISRGDVPRIRPHMTEEEVSEVLGSPGEQPRGLRATILAQRFKDNVGTLKWKVWEQKEEGTQPLAVAFDEEGKVRILTYTLPAPPPSLLHKIRRWLRLSS